MANYTLPSTTRISRVNRTLGSPTFLQASPFSGGVQSQDWGGSWWEYDLDFDVTQDAEGKALSAFLTRLRGPANTFTFRDPSINNKYQPGTIRVKGAGQTGNTLVTDGWSGAGTLFDAGDFISLGSGADTRLYQVMEPVVADSERNLIGYAADFSSIWNLPVGLTRSGAASVLAGEVASRYDNDGTTTSRAIQYAVKPSQNSLHTLTILVEQVDAPKIRFGIRNATDSSWFALCDYTFATQSTSVGPTGSGAYATSVDLGTGPNGGSLRQISISGIVDPSKVAVAYIYPTDATTNTDSGIVHWAQMEEGPSFTNLEVTEGISYDKTLTFEPTLRSSPADNTVVEVVDPIVALRPLQPVPNSISTPINYRFTMQARENI